MIFLAAVFADPIDLEGVTRGQVVKLASDLLFKLSNFLREELHGTATFGAHHMMMAPSIVLMFITGNAVMKRDFTGQAAFRQEFESTINGGVANVRVFFLHQAVKFIGGEVIAGFQKRAQDDVALCCLLEAHTLKMAMEDFLGLADHLAREGGLIINAFLQHSGQELSGYHRHFENEIHFQHARPPLWNTIEHSP